MLFFTYLKKCLCTNRNLVNTIVKSCYMHIHQIIKCPIPINYNLNGDSEIRTQNLLNVIQSLTQLSYTVSFIFTKFLFNRLFSHYTLCQPWKSKKTGPKTAFFSPAFCSLFTQKPQHLAVHLCYFFSLPKYIIIVIVSTCVDCVKKIFLESSETLVEAHI